MDNQIDTLQVRGNLSFLASIILGIMNWFGQPENLDMAFKVVTGVGAIVGLCFAIRYHWYATKYKKEQIKRLLEKEEDED